MNANTVAAAVSANSEQPTARQFKRNERATNSNGRKDKEFHFLRVLRVQFATPHQQHCRRRQRRHRGEKKTTESSLDVSV